MDESLAAMERITGTQPISAHCDKGYRGQKQSGQTHIRPAGAGPRIKTRIAKYLSKRRSSIEPTIGHLKSDHRMNRNFLKGIEDDKINPILAAAAYNLRKLIRALFLPGCYWLKKEIWGAPNTHATDKMIFSIGNAE